VDGNLRRPGLTQIGAGEGDPAQRAGSHGRCRLGGPIQRVEVQIDAGAWVPATSARREDAEFAWNIWSLEWAKPAPGEHTIVSRAIDTQGNVQPAPDDPRLAKKRTSWESNGQVMRRIQLT
jgi:hypothetical protein